MGMQADRSHEDGYKSLVDDTAATSCEVAPLAGRSRLARSVDDAFGITARRSTISTEVRGGCISWMTMSYIMVVNPVIISKADPSDPRLVEHVMFATAMSAAVGSLFVGVFANAPLGLMPGMGLNAYFAFGICLAFSVSWREALSCCFVSGLLLCILSAAGVCQAIVRMVLSDHLKKAITVAIGLFQALIGFQVMGLVVSSPDTLVTMGDMSSSNQQLYLSLVGLCAISALLVGQFHGALLVGIWGMAACSWVLGLAEPPQGVLGMPRIHEFWCVEFSAWHPGSGKLPSMIVGTCVMLFVALFDIAGVQYGLFGMARLLENGQVPRSNTVFASSGVGTMIGAVLGTSPVIIANESSAGIMEGAKTGLAAIVVSFLFFFSAFITPLLTAFPPVATAVPLVLIGAFMMSPGRGIDWDDLRIGIPSFLTITVVPFTYSIHDGIIAGIMMDFILGCLPRSAKEAEFLPHSPGGAFLSGAARSPAERRLFTPHTHMAALPSPYDKEERARRLLSDLQLEEEAEQRDEVLQRALEAYLEGRR